MRKDVLQMAGVEVCSGLIYAADDDVFHVLPSITVLDHLSCAMRLHTH